MQTQQQTIILLSVMMLWVLNTTGANANVAVGTYAFDANTTGDFNVAVGRGALSTNTTADHNTAYRLSVL
jgi:hypothetical protein